MTKSIKAVLNNGLDSMVRLTNILRKKEYRIKDIHMTSYENSRCVDLLLTIYEDEDTGVKRIINQMKKIHDVYDIEEVN
ncbi:ACT domain-containing protein [Clostridiaceae bacterium M8S5]|nr:ACT domain-containing protein [Clostridiaceae bacterium M8S5]